MIINELTNKLPEKQQIFDKNNKAVIRALSAGLSELNPNDMFRANILDKTPEGMKLRLLPGGDVLNAKTIGSPDVRIGDTVIFKVVENKKGQVLLEMVSSGDMAGKPALSDGVARGALMAAEMPVTPENIGLVQNLAKSGMPISAEALLKAAFFMYYDTKLELSFPQIKFLLDEGFPAEGKTIEVYRALMEGAASLNKQAGNIINLINNIPDKAVQSELLNVLLYNNKEGVVPLQKEAAAKTPVPGEAGVSDEQNLLEQVKSKLYIDIQQDGLKNLGKFYKELDFAASRLSQAVSGHLERENLPEPMREALFEILRNAGDVRGTLEFMNHVNETKEFMQIPFIVGTDAEGNQAELHVFRNKRGSGKEGGVNTALVALDYAELGHVQVHIQRYGNSVRLQFRAETAKILNILASETYRLTNALSGAGYSLSGMNFKKIGEGFEIHTVPEEWRSEDIGMTKYSVDVRV